MQVNPIVPVSPTQALDRSQPENAPPERAAASTLGGNPPAAITLAVKTPQPQTDAANDTPWQPAPPLRPTVQDRIDMIRVLLRLRV